MRCPEPIAAVVDTVGVWVRTTDDGSHVYVLEEDGVGGTGREVLQ